MAYHYIIIRNVSSDQPILYLCGDDSVGYLPVLCAYNSSFSVIISKNKNLDFFMGKSRKRQKNGKINGAKARQVRNAIERAAIERDRQDHAAGSDDDFEPPAKQKRKFHNNSSMCLMQNGVINSILKEFTSCRECHQGTLQCDITSYSGINANLVFVCDNCGIERYKWSGPDNINEAAIMATKYAGIKMRQFENWATCMNFGFRNNNGKDFTVNLSKTKTTKINEDINIRLDEMKKTDEEALRQQLCERTDKEQLELASDGMYPIRNDSGICLASVMATIDGSKKIIGEMFIITLYEKNTLLKCKIRYL